MHVLAHRACGRLFSASANSGVEASSAAVTALSGFMAGLADAYYAYITSTIHENAGGCRGGACGRY